MKNKYWLAFSSIEQIDSKFIKRLYDYFGDIEVAFKSSKKDLSEIDIDKKELEEIVDFFEEEKNQNQKAN